MKKFKETLKLWTVGILTSISLPMIIGEWSIGFLGNLLGIALFAFAGWLFSKWNID